MSTDATTCSSPKDSQCRLLELPAELRNRLYRDVLVSESIVISPSTLSQPPLLQTCHQIRAEASSIYYLENRFIPFVGGFNHKIILAFMMQMSSSIFGRIRASVRLSNSASSWANLLAWLKDWYHIGGMGVGLPDFEGVPKIHLAAAEAFRIVTEMRGKLRWEDVETLLLIHKRSTETQAAGDWKWT